MKDGSFLFMAGVIALPAVCTTLGAAGVLLMRRPAGPKVQRMLCGMAAGIMLAASVWSLLLPAIDRAEKMGLPAFLPSALGLVLGAAGLLRLEQTAGQLLAGDRVKAGGWCWQSRSTTCLRAWWWAWRQRWQPLVSRMRSAGRWL